MKAHPSPLIYNYCKQRDWRRIEIHCRTDPTDASYHCGNGDSATPLLVACSKQPTVRVIQALLEAYPKGVRVANSNGELPLHVACRSNASVTVLRTLADHNPAAASRLTNAGEDAIAVLLRTRDRTESHVNFHDPVFWASNTFDLRKMNYSSVFWQKVQVILEALGTHRQHQNLPCPETENLLVLHAAVSLSWCPAEILFYCCTQFPDEIRARDHMGRLPLHVAVGCTAVCRSNDTLIGKIQLREKSVVIPRLLQFFPQASRAADPTEPNGRYPLHTALLSRHEWHGGVKELWHHYPDAAMVVDPVERLLPFQLASFDLDTTYQLLRSAPAALLPLRTSEISALSKEIYFSVESPLEMTSSAEKVSVKGKPQAKKLRRVKKTIAPLKPTNAHVPLEVVWEPPRIEAVNEDRDIVFIAHGFEDAKVQTSESDTVPLEICIAMNEEGHPAAGVLSAESPRTEPLLNTVWKPQAKLKEKKFGFVVDEAERLLSKMVETEIPPIDPAFIEKARPSVVTMENRSCCTIPECVPQAIMLSAKSAGGSEVSMDVTTLIDSSSEFYIDKAMLSENEASNESKPQYYRKYKSMIATSITDTVDHGWRKDIAEKRFGIFRRTFLFE
jgi:hypothetical protein